VNCYSPNEFEVVLKKISSIFFLNPPSESIIPFHSHYLLRKKVVVFLLVLCAQSFSPLDYGMNLREKVG